MPLVAPQLSDITPFERHRCSNGLADRMLRASGGRSPARKTTSPYRQTIDAPKGCIRTRQSGVRFTAIPRCGCIFPDRPGSGFRHRRRFPGAGFIPPATIWSDWKSPSITGV
jgi:hypothetical protein